MDHTFEHNVLISNQWCSIVSSPFFAYLYYIWRHFSRAINEQKNLFNSNFSFIDAFSWTIFVKHELLWYSKSEAIKEERR